MGIIYIEMRTALGRECVCVHSVASGPMLISLPVASGRWCGVWTLLAGGKLLASSNLSVLLSL